MIIHKTVYTFFIGICFLASTGEPPDIVLIIQNYSILNQTIQQIINGKKIMTYNTNKKTYEKHFILVNIYIQFKTYFINADMAKRRRK